MSNAIKKWRESQGYRQVDFAKKVGIKCPVTIHIIETGGTQSFKKELVFKLFEISHGELTPNKIFGITDEMIEEKRLLKKE